MKYIKKYDSANMKNTEPYTYNDGDIVFININNQKKHEIDNSAIRFLDNLNPIQMIHNIGGFYYIENDNWYKNFFIEPDSIKRLATSKEIYNYLMMIKMKKYNII
jgi:hypothetical protein